MHYLTSLTAAADIRAMRTRITEIEAWRDSADDLFTGMSFQAAVDIAEAEVAALETEILSLCERFGITEEPYGEMVAA
ncbi:hypothetical protein [Mycobacteroides abscessus]|uniref:hypothetical protein n=1 Tax=Mycobacteroides abscessus TaxID=36809 RepID=UPI00092A5727|nr:hypothetical protein [Mycobacteroides abscessus]SHP98074.1 Uncharacterised protein [Mycobacteroides abscessus subsp. abscessus]SHQ60662.1 Uncharacterised protein [Mycobacteroides abscessus subsp. abscessus]SKD63939.1 Uncharacterised protein [Mycobacteroides abscessus subsp. abscessus]SLD62872.1 Uncharacterised protein [Mycobacteroides abscessus subsp. abscessus]